MSEPTRSEVLKELGTALAEMRQAAEKVRDKGKQHSAETLWRIEAIQVGYEFIMDNWKP